MEKALEGDARVENAKMRLRERMQRSEDKKPDDDDETQKKRRKLQDIEEKAMEEEDPGRLAELFEEYRGEYQRERERADADAGVLGELPSGSGDAIRREEMQVDEVASEEVEEEAFDGVGRCERHPVADRRSEEGKTGGGAAHVEQYLQDRQEKGGMHGL